MRDWFLYGVFLILVTAFTMNMSRCSYSTGKVNLNVSELPFLRLSDYQFFVGKLSDLSPNEGVLPYDLITPLFSDYALKARFLWMPAGSNAVYNDSAVFEFPTGTVLIKNFYYPYDFNELQNGRNILETRLLIKRNDGWDALPYIWKDDQSEAYLDVAGDNKKVNWVHHDGRKIGINYSIPNKNQCKSCHLNNGKLMPIGPKARNLNSTYLYAGDTLNQLAKWREAGYLNNLPANSDIPALPAWDDPTSGSLFDRAMAYLEVNCGHCHSPEGPAYTSGLHLTSTETNPSNLGICKPPVAAGTGSGGLDYDIVPGEPESSILVYRMESMDPGIMMPELGRQLPHSEAIVLIREWIATMEGSCN